MKVVELFRFVMPANLMGLPAACVATGVANGLPTGVQVMGTLFREDLCLDAAEAIERVVGVLTPIDPRARVVALVRPIGHEDVAAAVELLQRRLADAGVRGRVQGRRLLGGRRRDASPTR